MSHDEVLGDADDAEPGKLDVTYDWAYYNEGTVTIRYGEGSITLPVHDAPDLLGQASAEIRETMHERWWNS